MAAANRLYPGTAVVTGGGSGLGKEIARALLTEGYPVIITGRTRSILDQASEELGPGVQAIVCDVADEHSVEQFRQELGERGIEVSVLINNAGIGGTVAPLTDLSLAQWREVIDINLTGTFLMTRALLPAMQQRGNGHILTIASVTGKRPLVNRTPYAASKMAVIGMSNTLAFEAGPHGVMVNCLSPGPIVSERMARNFAAESQVSGRSPEEVEKEFTSRAALGRMVTFEEVAAAVVAALRIPGLTGSDIDFSGGMIA